VNNNYSINIYFPGIFLLIILFCSSQSYAQWVNNPSENTSLVSNVSDPVNISSVSDQNGGVFLFWQDNKTGFQNNVFFTHVNRSGKVDFKPEGMEISPDLGDEKIIGEKINPLAAENKPNTAVVAWKDLSKSKSGGLVAQKVSVTGDFLWERTGLSLSKTQEIISEYSISSDKNGNTFVVFITNDSSQNEFKINVQKVSAAGEIAFINGLTPSSSGFRKMSPGIVADDSGGAYLIWIEVEKNKNILVARHIDSSGNLTWGKKPLIISNKNQNVLSYSLDKSGEFIYLAWQVLKEKEIYHQLISSSGKILWEKGGKAPVKLKGIKSNPQVLAYDKSFFLTFSNEEKKGKNIYIHKFNSNGKPVWQNNPVPVIKTEGDQFGQKIVEDKKGGAIITWIDKRESPKGNIYAQRIDNTGKLLWDSLGLPAALSFNNEKSYLSIVPDNENGAVVIFKEKRDEKNIICGQKIFDTGTYIAQMAGFNTEIINDSVKISWFCANEPSGVKYYLESSDSLNENWQVINSFSSIENSTAVYHKFMDKPEVSGTVYYRVVQKNPDGNKHHSEVLKINYFTSSTGTVLAQNIPNPFSDSTVISFYLPGPSDVKIEFFDSRLEKINEVNQKDLPSGENKIVFYSQGLLAGIYFYRFSSKDFVDVKKMVLIGQHNE
jgi:hypothetical protein